MKEKKEQGRFEELIKARMDNYEVDAPTDMWASIETKLGSEAAKKTFILPSWTKYAAAAAVVVGIVATATLLHTPQPSTSPLPLATNHPIEKEIDNKIEEKTTVVTEPVETEIQEEVVSPPPTLIHLVKQPTSKQQPLVATATTTTATTTVEERVAQYKNEEPSKTQQDTQQEREAKYAEQLAAFEQAGREATATVIQEPSKDKKEKQFSLSLLAANSMATSNSQREEELLRNSSEYNIATNNTEEDVTYKHATPLSFGVKVAKQLSPSWSLESGIVYSILSSDITANHQEGIQMLHYLGIPIHAIWEIATINKFQFYLTSGAQVDFNVYGSQRFDSSIENITEKYFTDSETDNTPQWSLHMRGGASYQLSSKLALYLECGGAYYVDNSSSTVSVWKEQPLNLDLQLGLRTHF